MQRTITALVLLCAALFVLQTLPASEGGVVESTGLTNGSTTEQWVQTSVRDFEAAEHECVVVASVEDGAVTLARLEGVSYCTPGTLLSPEHQTSVLFNAVGAAWSVEQPTGTTFRLEVRASSDKETWTEWMAVSADEDGPETEGSVYGNLVEVPPARYLQYRFTLETFDTALSPTVHELVFTLINSMEGPTTEEAMATILPQEATSGVPQPRIISRKGWGANESWATREPVYSKPVAFIIHHTVTPNNPKDPAAIVRAILQYHAITRGWGDIGYNFLIDHEGNIYEGRKGGDGVVGIHAGQYNYGSIGIALMGDYRTAQMTPAMKQALVSLMAWEADRFGIDPQQSSYFINRNLPHILGHRDVMATVCPGDQVYRLLPELRKSVWQQLLAYDPRVEIEAPSAGEAVSGTVDVQVSSPSPTTATTRLLVDGVVQAEDQSSVRWRWDTRQVSEGTHRIEAVARSVEGRKSKVALEVTVDNTPPTGSMTINGGTSYASQVTVTLTLQAQDVRGEVTGMQFTQDEASEFTALEEFASTKQWVLGSGDGEKTVGVRYLDKAGNASAVYTSAITLDTQAPGGWNLGDAGQSGQVLVAVSDEASGVNPSSGAYSVSTDGGQSWGEWQPVPCELSEPSGKAAACRWQGDLADGLLRFRVADKAGNDGYSPSYGGESIPTPQARPTEPVPASTLPDLVVADLTAEDGRDGPAGRVDIIIAIENVGTVDVENGFWVELSIDPPAALVINSVTGPDGLAAYWYVPRLGASETLSLTIESADTRYTSFEGLLPTGTHEIYAYVDVYNSEGQAGLVSELDETNNSLGPVTVTVESGSGEDQVVPAGSTPSQIVRFFIQRLRTILARLRLHVQSP